MKNILAFVLCFGIFSALSGQKTPFKNIEFGNESVDLESVKIQEVVPSQSWSNQVQHSEKIVIEPIDELFIKKKNDALTPSYYQDGLPTVIRGEIQHKKTGSFSEKAMEYLEAASYEMQIRNPSKEFFLDTEWTDELGISHAKMLQTYNGFKIFGSEVILHGSNNSIDKLNGRYFASFSLKNINTDVEITIEEVKTLIKKKMDNFQDQIAFEKSSGLFPELKQWEIEQIILPIDGGFKSAYHVKVYANLAEYFTYFIDTQNGKVLNSYTNICKLHKHDHEPGECNHNHADPVKQAIVDGPAVATATDLLGESRTINTYEVGTSFYLVDATRTMFNTGSSVMPDDGVGVIHTIDAFNTAPQNSNFNYDHVVSGNNSWGNNAEGVSAHYNGGQAYLYFKNVHGRESISGDGSNIYSIVNVAGENGQSMGNAFWNGQAIFYGNGDNAFRSLGRSLDVAGHEMSHGVVQATANLTYQGESGAMNESFADVFGSMMDREDWLIGEDVVRTNAFPSGALRDMQDPHNGASSGNFGAGWQPKHTNEMYTGSQDNGGVHINSGIPNHAYYLFATDNAVGKQKAEKVWYRALANYLTKSSQFIDLRAAVTLAAQDLYDASVVNAANAAFDQVGIGSGGAVPNNYENDAIVNPGTDLLLFSDGNKSSLFIKEITTGNYFTFANPLTTTNQISRPSVTDDGQAIVFVGDDKKLYVINVDWAAGTATQGILNEEVPWRNVIVSKDGRRIAALTDERVNQIFVFDFGLGEGVNFDLFNPTYSTGVSTGDVEYADAMEFDLTGQNIVYDASNEISSNNSGSITYWDISFINVFDNSGDTWGTGEVSKLFNQLPENVDVGNPSFSKNSPYILTFDYRELNESGVYEYKMLGVNTESQDVGELFTNIDLSWPNYSRDDSKVVYDLPGFTGVDIGDLLVNDDKITTVTNSEGIEEIDARWPVWFSNGDRPLTGTEDLEIINSDFGIYPNPVSSLLNIKIDLESNDDAILKVINMEGKLMKMKMQDALDGENNWEVKVGDLPPGTYLIKIHHENKIYAQKFVKM